MWSSPAGVSQSQVTRSRRQNKGVAARGNSLNRVLGLGVGRRSSKTPCWGFFRCDISVMYQQRKFLLAESCEQNTSENVCIQLFKKTQGYWHRCQFGRAYGTFTLAFFILSCYSWYWFSMWNFTSRSANQDRDFCEDLVIYVEENYGYH